MSTGHKVTVLKPAASPLTVGAGKALQARITRNKIAYEAFHAEVEALTKLTHGMVPLQSVVDAVFVKGNKIYDECIDTAKEIDKHKAKLLDSQMHQEIEELRAYQAKQGYDDFWEDSSSDSDSDGYDNAEH